MLPWLRPRPLVTAVRPALRPRAVSCTPALARQPLPPRPSVREDEIEEAFLKGSGPGGQKISALFTTRDDLCRVVYIASAQNKTSSAVQLRHLPTGLVVKCQETRSRPQNRKIARLLLALKLEEREKGSESRAAKLRERVQKKKANRNKKSKRKYRKLEEDKKAAVVAAGGEGSGFEGGIAGTKAADAEADAEASVEAETAEGKSEEDDDGEEWVVVKEDYKDPDEVDEADDAAERGQWP